MRLGNVHHFLSSIYNFNYVCLFEHTRLLDVFQMVINYVGLQLATH